MARRQPRRRADVRRIPVGIDEKIRGVKLPVERAGRQFFGRPPTRPHFRLSIACADEERIGRACRRLGAALAPALSDARADR